MRERKKFKLYRCFDKDVIRQLHDKIFSTDEWVEDETVDWVVMDDSGQPVGFCMLAEHTPTTGFMARAGVLPSFQGHGLHTRLIRVRERFARAAGFARMVTYAKIENIKSSVNLQKAGYRIYKPAKEYADSDCIHWCKDL